jgi:regulator of sigma E protease
LSAGAIANFIFAFFLFWLAFIIGAPGYDQSRVMVQDVAPDSPAMLAGLQPGDLIVAVNGRTVAGDTEMLIAEIHASAGQPASLLIERDGQAFNLTVTPRLPGEYAANQGPTGIALGYPSTGRQPMGVVNAASAAGDSVWRVIYGTVTAPAMLIRGQLDPALARPVSVVGISQIAGHAAETSASGRDPFPILFFTGIISVALGFTNLLPLPALDGGRIMFVLLEAVRGRRIEPEREGMVHMVGMLFLLGLMVLIIIQDIVNPIIPF